MARDNETPEISVIVPVYNGAETLGSCLDALFESVDVRFEVIVVDDASTDASAQVASLYPVTLLRLPERVGGGLARNPGAAKARAPILLFTDADVAVRPSTLTSILEAFHEDPDLHALFGAYGPQCPHRDFFTRYKNLHHHYHHGDRRRHVPTFWTGCGAVKREVFAACGGFRGLCHLYDIDLGYRMMRKGFRTEVDPEIQVTHHKRYTFGSLLRSDILDRAVLWTRLMLEHRVFQNDLNTRCSQVASVLCVYAAIGALLLLRPWWAGVAAFVGVLGLVAVLNVHWVRYCAQEAGRPFALGALCMEWLYFFYSGLGVLAGTCLYLAGRGSKGNQGAR